MHRELLVPGIKCCRNTVAKCMRKAGITENLRSNFRISTTDSHRDFPIAPHLLNQTFAAHELDQIWLTDITCIPTREGFTYLCALADLCSRKIVGWKTSRPMDSELVMGALEQAVAQRSPTAGWVVHRDRGSQYASHAFRGRLPHYRMTQSMNRRGNCDDNAVME